MKAETDDLGEIYRHCPSMQKQSYKIKAHLELNLIMDSKKASTGISAAEGKCGLAGKWCKGPGGNGYGRGCFLCFGFYW